MVAGEGHAPADDDDLGIEHVEQVRDAGAEELGGVVHHLERELVPVVRGLVHRLRGDLRGVTTHVAGQAGLRAGLHPLDGAQRDVRPGGVGLEAAVVAAFAAAPFGVDRGVADLARDVRCAVVQPAVEDETPADPGADGDADGVATSARGADPPLAQHRAVGVVVELGREAEPVADDLAEGEVHPAEVGGEEHDAALGVERAGRADTDTEDLGSRHFALGAGAALLGQRDQPVHHVARARLRVGRGGGEGLQGAAVLGHAPHDQIGPADVNAEYESHADPPLPRP